MVVPYSIISTTNSECVLGSLLLAILPFLGNMFGGFLYIYISNNSTYKSLIFTASSSLIISYMLMTVQSDLFIIFISICLSTIQTNSILCSTFILGVEMEKGKERAKFAKYVYLGYHFCYLFYSVILMKAFNFHWHSILGINILITGIVELFFYYYTVESPRMLIKIQRNADALESLKQIAKYNEVYEEFSNKSNHPNINSL